MARLPAVIAGILVAAVTVTSGCRTSTPTAHRHGVRVLRPGQPLDPGRLELSKDDEDEIEAHARFAAGLVEEMSDEPEEAAAHFEAAAAHDPENEALTFEAARRLVELRRLDKARELLERSASRPDASGLVWGWLGLIHALQKDKPGAIKANEEAIRRLPTSIGAYQMLARIYLGAGQVGEALAVLEAAAKQPDTDATFLLVLADTLGVLQQVKDPAVGNLRPRILALLDRAAAQNPTDPPQLLRLADLYQLFGEGAKSLPLYERVLKSNPDLPGLRERLTGVYFRTDNREKAAEQLRILVREQPSNPLPHYFLGLLALEAKQYDEAIDAFNRVLLLRPDEDDVYFDLVVAQLSHRRPEDALGVLERARARFRPSFRLEFYSAAALLELKRYEDAIRHFTAAEVIGGAMTPHDLTAPFYFQSGVAYERARRFDDAAVQFEKAIELEPDFGDALNYLGYMWAEQGTNLERARELIHKALVLEPDNEAFLDSYAWVLHQLGHPDEALPQQLRAVELAKEPDATLYDHLGDIYQRLGRVEDARKAWQKAQEIEAKPEVGKKLLDATPR